MAKKKTILLIPYPAQGHITPMLNLSSLLSDLGFRPVLITPEFIHRRINNLGDDLLCLSIPDGLDGGTPPDFFSIERAMEEIMPDFLEELVRKMIDDDDEDVVCLVADLLASWAFDVGRRCGLSVAGFWPAMYATYRVVDSIPELIENGIISDDGCPNDPNATICLSPNGPTLIANHLPWLIGSSTARIARFKFWTRTLARSKTLRFLLVNTFPDEVKHKVKQSNIVVGVGPLIEQDATTLTINKRSLWEEDTSCLAWLDGRAPRSVLYVSFGSWVGPIDDLKISRLASALEELGMPFVWVMGPAWRVGLPEGYVERVVRHGRIVSWAPQMEVLRHVAVGCYLTHCGWNSTVEAVRCMKPMLCCPIAGDQFVNCAYVVDDWRVGAKMEGFGVEEVEKGIRKVVEDEGMVERLEKANDKLFGGEGRSKAMENLLTFIQGVDK